MEKQCFFLALLLMVLHASGTPTSLIQTHRSTMLEGRGRGAVKGVRRPSKSDLAALQDRLRYTFNATDLLMDALTHASYSERNNEVLCILGGKVVQQAIALRLIRENPDIAKGELESYMEDFTGGKVCAKEALALGLDSVIMVGRNVDINNQKILAAAFKAIFGAIAVDDGPTKANLVYWKIKQWKSLTAKET